MKHWFYGRMTAIWKRLLPLLAAAVLLTAPGRAEGIRQTEIPVTDIGPLRIGQTEGREAGDKVCRDVFQSALNALCTGAANLVNPYASRDIVEELPAVMAKYGISRLKK